ncbi:hypothetical protein SAMN05421786_103246 [Chryseobacterium ureilyticum]|uniref:Uncharacterized protein n=1 Tax=Chryseobacterium ureilyticum TaxID=373668 RepID=A0A1N7N6M7_9FLAO|nr:hypothetical protein [Chryseobacterium ureilyticum]SIS93811.1 hypothetical protein SAMN05421786_103246 [Chryseobacterium ureilyticum]
MKTKKNKEMLKNEKQFYFKNKGWKSNQQLLSVKHKIRSYAG